MERVTIDPGTRSRLGDLGHQLELCDETGQTLGYFVPAVRYPREVYRWAEEQLSAEELQRRKNEPGERTTAEVLRRLERQ